MINQPQNNPNIPEDLARAVKNAQDSVTMAQLEVNRLKELNASEIYSLDQLNKEKKYLESQVEVLTDLFNTTNSEFIAIQEKLSDAKNDLTDLNKAKADLESLFEKKNSEMLKWEEGKQKEAEAIDSKVKELENKEIEMNIARSFINTKKEALENALKEI